MIRIMLAIGLAVWMVCEPVRAEDHRVSTGDEKTDEMMVGVQELLKGVASLTARLTTRIDLLGEVFEDEADAAFQTPDRIRFDAVNEGKRVPTFLVNGGMMWMYDPDENVVTRFNRSRIFRETRSEADAYVLDPLRPFRGLKWHTIRYAGTTSVNGQPCRVFEAEPEPDLLSAQLPVTPVKVRLLIHAEDGLVRAGFVLDEKGNEVVTRRFDRVKANVSLAKDWFDFVVPRGAYVVDATEETVELLKTAGREHP